MRRNRPGGFIERVYVEAIMMGLLIGMAALFIDRWVGDLSWARRILALAVVGGILCLVQFGITRVRRK